MSFEQRLKEKIGIAAVGRQEGEDVIMKKSRASSIAVIGYIFGDNRISVSYDTENEIFIVEEEYSDKELGITVRFSDIVESREEVRESLNRFKKSFNK